MSDETCIELNEMLSIKEKMLHVLGYLNDAFVTIEMPSDSYEASQEFVDRHLLKLTCAMAARDRKQIAKWTNEEHALFLQYLPILGRNSHTEMAKIIKTKNAQQVSSHSQKFFDKVKKELMKIEAPTKAQKLDMAQRVLDQFGIHRSIHSSLLYDAFGDTL